MSTKPLPIIVLGSGESILALSDAEISFINQSPIVIAINKYAAFWELARIRPTHIYFVDTHDNSLEILQFIHNKVLHTNGYRPTFILHESIRNKIHATRSSRYAPIIPSVISDLKNHIHYNIFRSLIKHVKNDHLFYAIHESTYQFIEISDWMTGGSWASELSQPLFHYRGSLTTVLNYCSIIAPGREIYLIGNDFNGSRYFYQNELESSHFKWKDWTYDITNTHQRHFSFIDYKGTKMSDVFSLIHTHLSQTNNKLYCTNPNSLLVTQCSVNYQKLPCA